MTAAVRIVAVVPIGSRTAARLERAGWSSTRANGFTLTLISKPYDSTEHAICDARILPNDVIWGLEATHAQEAA